MQKIQDPVLLIGSTGVIGGRVARMLRSLHPSLPLTIVGRDTAQAQSIASELGNASVAIISIEKPSLGLNDTQKFSAVAIFMKDDSLNSLRFAQSRGIPYMDVSSAAFEIGPEVARFIHNPTAGAVLMNSNWLAGTSTSVALYFASEYENITSIVVSALLDSADIGGAAATTDYERQTKAVTSALVLQDGIWKWLSGDATRSSFLDSAGNSHVSQLFSNLDVLSLGTATTAKNVRFEFAVGDTAAKQAGRHFSHEIIITIEGTRKDGRSGSFRYEIIHPEGQAPMTALSAAVGVEALLGLHTSNARMATPGLYLPSTLINPAHAVKRLISIGTTIKEIGMWNGII